uniref:Sodium/nucleoside cotransporter n=1 Tax=Strongyloides stercoralis TaxID=6248 RepID=A0A0K0E4U4_STRER
MNNKSDEEIDTNTELELKYITCNNDQTFSEHCLQNIPLEILPISNEKEREKNEEKQKKNDRIFNKIKNIYTKNRKKFRYFLYSLFLILYHIYLIFAVIHNVEKAKDILIITGIFWIILLFFIIKNYISINGTKIKLCRGQNLSYYIKEFQTIWNKYGNKFKYQCIFYGIIFIGIAIFIERDTKNNRSRLQGLSGLLFFIFFMFTFSKSRKNINWNTVINGYLVQFFIAIFVFKIGIGVTLLEKFSNECVKFLSVTYKGTDFVYGHLSSPPKICGVGEIFAFKTLQVLIFFNTTVVILNHFNIIGRTLKYISGIIRFVLGTTSVESFNACACVLLGMTEGPVLVKNYISKMTLSELHTICSSGFSCIAGSLFAAYINLGACPNYLLTSSILSAPGSIAASKLLYPETEESTLKNDNNLIIEKHKGNLLEKISSEAVIAAGWVVAIAANLVVFLAILYFLDNTVEYFGDRIGINNLSFSLILGYAFYPLAFLMGVTDGSENVLEVAKLMGTKTFLNEFIAYQKLGELIAISPQLLTAKSAMIATFALCGFSNIGSIGIQLAILGSMAPTRKVDIANIIIRSLITGSISTFWTATLAGIIIEEPHVCSPKSYNKECFDIDKGITILKNY